MDENRNKNFNNQHSPISEGDNPVNFWDEEPDLSEDEFEPNMPEPETSFVAPKPHASKLPFIISGIAAGVAAVATVAAVVIALFLGGNNKPPQPVPSTPEHEHSFGEWIVVDEATCTEKGEKERICECGEKETRSIDALGHTEVIDTAIAPSCTEIGLTEGKHCSTCGTIILAQQEIAKTNHIFDDEYDGECNNCGFKNSIAFATARLAVESIVSARR